MAEAEDRTARYYCFPPHQWQHLRFDLLTRRDREWAPLPDHVLAKVQRFSRAGPAVRASYEFFRIQLNDPTILDVTRREEPRVGLYPLLVYVLTHEMVHLVRLSTMVDERALAAGARLEEENRVNRISRQILAGASHLYLDSVLEKFELRPAGAGLGDCLAS